MLNSLTVLLKKIRNRALFAWRIGLLHLAVSIFFATLVAAFGFTQWFTYPYSELIGGRELFILIVSVDVVCGPLLTLILISPAKSRREMVFDLSVVALIQLSALSYGLYTLSLARPVALVFEVDRFRAVTASEIAFTDLALAPPKFKSLSWTGPNILGIHPPKDAEDRLRSIDLSLQGIEPSMRPQWWQDYELSVPQVLAKAKAMDLLRRKHPAHSAQIDEVLSSAGLTDAGSLWLPLVGRKSSEWVVLLDAKTAQPKAYLPLDGF